MRATRRNMEQWPGSVMISDEADECSASPGDYFQYGMDDDLGGVLVRKLTVMIAPDQRWAFHDLMLKWAETHDIW